MSNCIIFALTKWFREGGYIIVRKSRYGWWPHMFWCADLENIKLIDYSPPTKRAGLLPPPLFRGVQTQRRGDK